MDEDIWITGPKETTLTISIEKQKHISTETLLADYYSTGAKRSNQNTGCTCVGGENEIGTNKNNYNNNNNL